MPHKTHSSDSKSSLAITRPSAIKHTLAPRKLFAPLLKVVQTLGDSWTATIPQSTYAPDSAESEPATPVPAAVAIPTQQTVPSITSLHPLRPQRTLTSRHGTVPLAFCLWGPDLCNHRRSGRVGTARGTLFAPPASQLCDGCHIKMHAHSHLLCPPFGLNSGVQGHKKVSSWKSADRSC